MFGLFDSPIQKIRKKIPPWEKTAFNAAYIDVQLTCNLGTKKHNALAHGFLMSVWAVNFVKREYPEWDDKDLTFIFNMGQNCMRFLPSEHHTKVTEALGKLIDRGQIPAPTNSMDFLSE